MFKQKKSFIAKIKKRVIFLYLLFLIVILFGITIENEHNFQIMSKVINENYITFHKQMIKQKINSIIDTIDFSKKEVEKKHPNNNIAIQKLQKRILAELAKKNANNRYIFVVSYDGVTLMNSNQPHLIGYNIWNFTDPNGVKVIQEERKVVEAPEGGFISYSWEKPSTKQISQKIAFVKGVKDWKWMIGTGFYVNDVELEINLLYVKLYNTLRLKMLYCVILFLFISPFLLLFLNKLTNQLQNDMNLFTPFFQKAAVYNKKINVKEIKFLEFNQLAVSANEMIDDKIKIQHELHDEKEELLVTINSITNGLITTDKTGRIKLMNVMAEKLTGYYFSDVIDKKIDDVFHIHDYNSRTLLDNPVYEILQKNINIQTVFSVLLVAKNGTEYNIDYNATPFNDSDGNIIGAILVFRDMTEKIKIDHELRKMKKLESIGLLAGGIAHDFNNILTGIYGNIEIAAMKLSNEHTAYNYLKRSLKSVDRATKLTHQLLTFSKGGSPTLKYIHLKDLIEAIVKFNMSGCNIKSHLQIPDDLWQVKADEGQISQVIENLVFNAKQAMPDGGNLYITLTNMLEGAMDYPKGDLVQFIIKDEGVGISENDIGKIFDPYYTTKEVGHGLGLATVYSIINKHNGSIEVESIPKKGTSFTIYLPAKNKVIKNNFQKNEVLEQNDIKNSNVSVLVMDNENSILELVTDMLESFGYSVEIAKDGDEAIKKYRTALNIKKPFDLVIMDLTIPGAMGGQDAVKKLLSFDKNAKVIVCSGYSSDPVMAHFQKFGFKGKIVKPFTATYLNKIVKKVLDI
jgi:PAS domain S-box-containing protein